MMPQEQITESEKYVREKLFEMHDEKYRDFNSKLIPNIDKEIVIGVRTPQLRNFAKEFSNTKYADEFMSILPHKYYEENNIHGFLIERMKDYDRIIEELDRFLPCVDNWATCDLMSPKAFKKHLPQLIGKIKEWVSDEKTYTIRFGIEMLMSFYLDEHFNTEYLMIVANVKSEEYYVNMMIAWFFATALAKQYDSTIPYIAENKLDKWCHNKTIQKAVESYRITDEQKKYLKTLKIK